MPRVVLVPFNSTKPPNGYITHTLTEDHAHTYFKRLHLSHPQLTYDLFDYDLGIGRGTVVQQKLYTAPGTTSNPSEALCMPIFFCHDDILGTSVTEALTFDVYGQKQTGDLTWAEFRWERNLKLHLDVSLV